MLLSLSYGVPVITRRIPATEIIHDRKGYVFENDSELADILKSLQPMNESMQKERSRDIIHDIRKFDWSYSAKKLIRIYGEL